MYSWNLIKRKIDEFLVETMDLPRDTGLVEIYNRFADYLALSHICLRNPENATKVLGYLNEHRSILWDAEAKEALQIMIEADRRFEKRNHISL